MKTYKILIPIFNDWESLLSLLNNIHTLKINNIAHIKVLIVDDCSTEILNKKIEFDSFKNIEITVMLAGRFFLKTIMKLFVK